MGDAVGLAGLGTTELHCPKCQRWVGVLVAFAAIHVEFAKDWPKYRCSDCKAQEADQKVGVAYG